MAGSGRSFDELGFLSKLQEIEGRIVSDVESFPSVPFWILPKATVRDWHQNGKSGAGTKVSRPTALKPEFVWRGAADCAKFQNLPLFEPHKVYVRKC